MRLGLFGGTFDPVHFGHLLLAEQCREQCELDAVWFLPAGSPPHKQGEEIADGRQRTELLELAAAGHAAFSVNDMELKRAGPTYSVDTLQEIAGAHSDWERFFLIGADSLHDLPKWREPQRILELATVVAVNRGGRPLPDMSSIISQVGDIAAERIRTIDMPGVDLSASDIRRRVAAGKSIRFMTPRSVEVYIQPYRLYRADDDCGDAGNHSD